MKKTIHIIGSGFSSLAASCYLAKAGYNVTIFEKNKTIGGRARQLKRDGFVFDIGPTWYWMPDVFERFFSDFNKKPSQYYALEKLNPAYSVYYGKDDFITIEDTLEKIIKAFEKEEPGSSKKLNKFIKDAKDNYEVAIKDLVYNPGVSPLELITPTTIKKINQFFSTIKRDVRKEFKNERLIKILEFPVLFLGAKPSDTPSFYSFMNYADFGLGTFHPKKGMYQVILAMESLAKELGVTIKTEAPIDNIIVENGEAKGVEYFDLKRGKKLKSIKANKEVILSAGVINSPQILMLTGIGAAKELAKHHIPLVKDLPGVGENLQDHPDVIIRCSDKSNSSLTTVPKPSMLKFFARFYRKSEHIVFTPTDAGGYIKSDASVAVPDLQLQFAPIRMFPHGTKPLTPSKAGFVLHVCHMRPKSRGNIKLKSNNPLDAPIINANYFDNEFELDALVKGVKIAREILSQPAFSTMLKEEEMPGKNVVSDKEIRQFILDRVESVYHTAGSCKMGIDDMAVVDPELKVYGIKNLRVVDSSIFPTITGSNIHAPTVMIAEKAADMILNQ